MLDRLHCAPGRCLTGGAAPPSRRAAAWTGATPMRPSPRPSPLWRVTSRRSRRWGPRAAAAVCGALAAGRRRERRRPARRLRRDARRRHHDLGSAVRAVLVDVVRVGPTTPNTCAFPPLTSDHAISVEFALQRHTIVSSAGASRHDLARRHRQPARRRRPELRDQVRPRLPRRRGARRQPLRRRRDHFHFHQRHLRPYDRRLFRPRPLRTALQEG